ncbi:hypothetical protein [Pseudomonas sp.]|uniref:hypothetical protein n=1 Tax=Pseudomonas sp. TaxID=306 RepID=UPI002907FD69|nr:hypothetical protein [Pseudomonas sp.]MDU4250804.1 hypothetical protein [Pseudomonas sp.]
MTAPQDNPFQTPAAPLQDNSSPVPGEPLFRLAAAGIATFFGTPIAGSWVIAQNLKRLNRPQEVQKAWLVGIGITVLIFILSWFLPDNFPAAPINIAAVFAMHQYAKQNTADALDRHAAAGGSYLSNWRAFGVSLLFLIVIMAVVFGAAFVLALTGNA